MFQNKFQGMLSLNVLEEKQHEKTRLGVAYAGRQSVTSLTSQISRDWVESAFIFPAAVHSLESCPFQEL